MAFWFKSKETVAKEAAETFLRTEWAGVVSNPRPYAETARSYYTAVKSWIDVNNTLDAKMEGLFSAAATAARGSEAEENANVALWKEMNSAWVQQAAEIQKAANVPSIIANNKNWFIGETERAYNAAKATEASRRLLATYVKEQPRFVPSEKESEKIHGDAHYNYFEDVIKEKHTKQEYKDNDDKWWFVHDFRLRLWSHGHPQAPELRREEVPEAAGGGAPSGAAPAGSVTGPEKEDVDKKPEPLPEVEGGAPTGAGPVTGPEKEEDDKKHTPLPEAGPCWTSDRTEKGRGRQET